MVRIAIFEDDKNAVSLLKIYLKKYFRSDFELVKISDNCKDLFLEEVLFKTDLLFLDIHLDDGLSIDTMNELLIDYKGMIVFTSAYDKYILNALRFKVFDFLLKPIGELDFQEFVSRFENQRKFSTNRNSFIYELTGHSYFVFAKADGPYTKFTFETKKNLVLSKTLKYINEQLSANDKYLRIHKSYMVNKQFISKIDLEKNEITMQTGDVLPIAASRKSYIKDAL